MQPVTALPSLAQWRYLEEWELVIDMCLSVVQTEVATRFSLVTHGRDSPEGLRDVRGFATKFYTSEGNWDLVGNNIPVSNLRH